MVKDWSLTNFFDKFFDEILTNFWRIFWRTQLSTQIMVNSHYGKRLKLFQFYLIITSAIFIEYHECRRDYTNCCEILKIISSSFLAKFHPEHLGSYKLMKNSKNVYISLTEPNSYIYLLSLGKGNSDVLNIELCM